MYAWSTAVFFGAVVLDIVYSRLLRDAVGSGPASSVYREVSDFLLLLGAFPLLAALLAIGVSWRVPRARNLFPISLVAVASEFFVPVVLFPLLRISTQSDLAMGRFIRLIPIALASLLAVAGFRSSILASPSPMPTA